MSNTCSCKLILAVLSPYTNSSNRIIFACGIALQDERQLHSLMDALAVAEFLSTFAGVCGAPLLGLAQLQQAAAWPLDGPELFETYSSLVKYLLAQWVSGVQG